MITARATAKAHDVPVASDTVWENRSNQQESPFRFVFIVSILVLGKCIPAMAAESIPQERGILTWRSVSTSGTLFRSNIVARPARRREPGLLGGLKSWRP